LEGSGPFYNYFSNFKGFFGNFWSVGWFLEKCRAYLKKVRDFWIFENYFSTGKFVDRGHCLWIEQSLEAGEMGSYPFGVDLILVMDIGFGGSDVVDGRAVARGGGRWQGHRSRGIEVLGLTSGHQR
jgi:hypothetical protein